MRYPPRFYARAWMILFNDHIRDCPGCSTDPDALRLCSLGKWLNDEVSAAAALALTAEAEQQ